MLVVVDVDIDQNKMDEMVVVVAAAVVVVGFEVANGGMVLVQHDYYKENMTLVKVQYVKMEIGIAVVVLVCAFHILHCY